MTIIRCLTWPFRRRVLGNRGSIAVMFGVAIVPMLIGTVAAIDISRMMASKSALQRIADNAALTGAAVYTAYTASDSFKAIAETMAVSSFCNAASALPAGFLLTTPSTGVVRDCGSGTGPTTVGQIAGYTVGVRGLTNGSGCTATNTVAASPVKCGFAVTVTARAQMTSLSAQLMGPTSVSVTSTAMNPFIDLSKALEKSFLSAAENANSVWVYPVLLDVDGNPDFSTNAGALPDRSTCTGDPLQFNCGVYTMLASNHFNSCSDAAPCTYGSTRVGSSGVVLNPTASTAVITATTPLGFGFVSTANANNPTPKTWYGPCSEDGNDAANFVPDRVITQATAAAGSTFTYQCDGHDGNSSTATFPRFSDPRTGCVYPFSAVYNTITQMFRKDGSGTEQPLMPWSVATHFFYSSYLNNNLSPMQPDLDFQQQTGSYSVAGRTHNNNQQKISPVEDDNAAYIRVNEKNKNNCTPITTVNGISTYPDAWYIYKTTSYETPRSNCALVIVKDPTSNAPDGSYAESRPNARSTTPNYKTCFSPVVTDSNPTPGNKPGERYGIIQCQDFKGHTFAYLWNDASGKADDTDYGNGGISVICKSKSNVVLID